MNAILLALSLLSAPVSNADDFDERDDVGAPNVRYLSWCVRNVVMEEGPRGLPVIKADCTRSREVCVQEERIVGGGRVSFAFCSKRR